MPAVARAACLVVVACTMPAWAVPQSVQLRWKPSKDPVAGYRAHARPLDDGPGATADLGLPMTASDGTLQFEWGGLDDAQDHAVAVSAYDFDGSESVLSRELAVYGAACRDATGVSGARVAVKPTGRRAGVAARGTLALPRAIDPTVDGLTIVVSTADGTIVYSVHLAPSELRADGTGDTIRWIGKRTNGLRRLTIHRRDDGTARIRMRALGRPPKRARKRETLTWVLRVGDDCLRAGNLRCHGAHGALSCAGRHG